MKLDIQKFAVSKSTSFSESNISIPNNTSSLIINVYFSPNNSVTWFQSKPLYCTCNGVTQSKNVSLSKGGSVSASFTFNNIPHNNDGTKTVAWSWNCNTGTSVLGNISDSGNRALTKIARASGLSFSPDPAELGQAVTISLTKYIEGTTDELSFEIGGISGVIGTTDEDMYIWTPPITLAEAITNSTSGTCVISCTSYDGDTLIGTSTANLTLEVPSSIVPSVSIGTITEANESIAALNWGVFVQNKSQLNIPITANGIYGSDIVSIVTSINGNMFNGYNIITPTLTTSGTSTITTIVTDTRGRTATATTTYSVEPYANPSITSVEVQRCLSNGTIDEDGTYLLYTFVGSISSVANHNSKVFQIGYKKTTDENYTFATISSTYSVNEQDSVSSFTISPDYAYDIIFQAVDSFMTTGIGRELTVGFDLMNFSPSGKAMAIGKVSEAGANEELLEIDLPTKITQNMEIQDISGGDASFDSVSINGREITGKNILTAKPTADTTLTTQNPTKITLEESYNIGDKLSIDDDEGGIKIGSGISKIMVSGTILFLTGGTSSTRKGIQIFMYDASANTTNVIVYNNIGGSVTYTGASCTPFILEVEEDDIIYMYGINQGATGSVVSSDNTYLTIEVIE